jgi:hypothetical protein
MLVGVNESAMVTVDNEDSFTASIASGSSYSAKLTLIPHNRNIELMEKALHIWLDGQNRKKAGQSTLLIRERAKCLCEYFVSCAGEVYDTKAFQASSGWFERSKKCSSLHNLKFESDESAQSFPGVFRKTH